MKMRSRYNYQSFVLRLWQEDGPGEWRGCLQSISTGKYHFFSSIDGLFTYLYSQIRFTPIAELGGLEPGGVKGLASSSAAPAKPAAD